MSVDRVWGCNTKHPEYRPRKSGYWAPSGYKMAQVGECGHKVVLPQMQWIVDVSTQSCQADARFYDPACTGCDRRGSE